MEEFSAGNYPEARALFARAHELYPNARTLRGLGMVAFELRNYGVCVENLEASLASTERPLPDRLRSETADTLARARAFIARINLKVSPKTARVWLDGVPVEVVEGQALVLEVGDHVFEVQAMGYRSERRAVSITGGERLKLSVVMQQPQPGGAADSSHHDDSAPARRRWYRNPWVWTGVAVLAAGVGVGIALALRPGEKVEPMGPTRTPNTPTSGVFQSIGSW